MAGQYRVRYGNKAAFAVTIVFFAAASVTLLPELQSLLEDQLIPLEAVPRVQGLLLNTGTALIGAAAIVTSLVLFSMQVNVERMPHGLFRRLSEDRKLLGSFASAFVLAIVVAVMSTVVEQTRLALPLVLATWSVSAILVLFLYAYRRALKLINPLEQLQILLYDTRKGLCDWGRKADRYKLPPQTGEQVTDLQLPECSNPDTVRTQFFLANPRWTTGATRSLHHAMSFARRYAEQRDYEVSGYALDAVVEINAAYIKAKGKTFYANALMVEHPLSYDAFITESLECLRQNSDTAIRRRDERQIEQLMRALSELVRLYLQIDYGSHTVERHHAQLAGGYLGNAVEAAVGQDMADVLMEGQRLLGQAARYCVAAGSEGDTALLSKNIRRVALAGCINENYRPVTTEGLTQYANLTLDLLCARGHRVEYALMEIRGSVFAIAKQFLKVPDALFYDIHGTTLGPYFSSSDYQSLRVKLTVLVNSVSNAEPDNEVVQTIIGNITQWGDGLYQPTKELLLAAVAEKSHFTIHMFQWIQSVTEILLVASNAPACGHHRQKELRNQARWLIATLSWIPEDKESVSFAGRLQLTDALFEAAQRVHELSCFEDTEKAAELLLNWAFKAGRHISCGDIFEEGLYGCAALAVSEPLGAREALLNKISRYLQTERAPMPDVLAQGADGLRRRVAAAMRPGYGISTIDRAVRGSDKAALGVLVEEIAEILCPRSSQ